MSSEAQKKAGWILPEPIDPGDRICVQFEIPNDPLYRAATRGAVEELAKWWNWERSYDIGDTRASQAAQLFLDALSETYQEDCVNCIDVVDCVDDDPGYIALTQYQFDQISNVTAIYAAQLNDDYDGTPQSIGADIPVGVPDAGESNALCYSLAKYVDFYAASKRAQISTANNWRVLLDELRSAVQPFYNFASDTMSGVTLPDIYACYVDFETAFTALANQDAKDEFACCLYDNLKSVVISETTFNTAISDCAASLAGDAQKIACIFDNDNDLTVFLIFLSGYQINIERQVSEGDMPCDCFDGWCQEFDFTTSDEGFTVIGGYGTYVSGAWQGTASLNGDSIYIQKLFGIGMILMTHYEIDLRYGGVGDTAFSATYSTLGNKIDDHSNQPSGIFTSELFGNSNDTGIRVNVGCNALGAGLPSQAYKLRVYGTGLNPFPVPNCP